MHIDRLSRGANLIFVTILIAFLALSSHLAQAEEKADDAVREALVQRTNTFCNSVLPSWFKSEAGIEDPVVRDLVTDCYMGQARLKILGVKTDFPLETAALKEVPAILMQQETGINLDIFKPLAGRTIRTATSVNGD